MGIKELWSILGPYCERKPLYELQGKIVAIDLSGWICDSQNVVDYIVQPKLYLRNLYFRTSFLLLSGVTPVFVLEGTAPPLKYGVICKRNEIQFKGARPRTANNITKPDKGRTRFNAVLKLCEELLMSMGLQCVQGSGEAEALCAYLNEDNLVDGVISQDSDCFGYGAKTVYRNFSVSQQGHVAAQGGAVDVYDITRVRDNIDLGRNHMVTLALLCGCDYKPEGVGGVGKDAALKFISSFSDNEILSRLESWRSEDAKFTSMEVRVDDKLTCTQCGHRGRAQSHAKTGCPPCGMTRGCDSSLYYEERLMLKNELQIRRKALIDDDFPNRDIISEFLTRPTKLPKLDLRWKQPQLVKFTKMMGNQLGWSEIYCVQKFLPLLTRWQLLNPAIADVTSKLGTIAPECIRKKRNPKGIASFQIIWNDTTNSFGGLVPEDQIESFISENPKGVTALWSTIEPCDLVNKTYPDLIIKYEEFLESKKVKKGKKRGTKEKYIPTKKSRKKKSISSVEDLTEIMNALEGVQQQNISKNKCKTIDDFFKPKKSATYLAKSSKHLVESRKLNLSDFPSDFESDNDCDLDLSSIIDNIVSRPGVCKDRIIINQKANDATGDVIVTQSSKLNESYFFDNFLIENDEFEKTFNLLTQGAEEDDFDTGNKSNQEVSDHLNKSASESPDKLNSKFEYIPLLQRIKNKK